MLSVLLRHVSCHAQSNRQPRLEYAPTLMVLVEGIVDFRAPSDLIPCFPLHSLDRTRFRRANDAQRSLTEMAGS